MAAGTSNGARSSCKGQAQAPAMECEAPEVVNCQLPNVEREAPDAAKNRLILKGSQIYHRPVERKAPEVENCQLPNGECEAPDVAKSLKDSQTAIALSDCRWVRWGCEAPPAALFTRKVAVRWM